VVARNLGQRGRKRDLSARHLAQLAEQAVTMSLHESATPGPVAVLHGLLRSVR
jgi:hypothetical protein